MVSMTRNEMKVTLETSELLAGLNKLSKVITSKVTIPVLTCVKMKAKNGKLELIGSDVDLSAIVTIENVNVETEGSIVLIYKNIHAFIKKSKGHTISIYNNGESTIVSNGKIELKVKTIDSEEYPSLPYIKGEYIALRSEEFRKAIKNTSYAVSKSESRPVLNAINIKATNNHLKFTATDSHRLGLYEVDINQDMNNIEVNPIGSKLDVIIKMLEKKNDTVNLLMDSEYTVLEFDNVKALIRNKEGNYPDTSRLIPEDFKTELTFNVKELLETLPQLSIFATDRNNIMKLDYNKSKATVSSHAPEEGEINANIDVISAYGEEVKLSFSLKYLEEALKTIDNKNVTIKFNGHLKPFILQGDNNTKHLLLPCRTY